MGYFLFFVAVVVIFFVVKNKQNADGEPSAPFFGSKKIKREKITEQWTMLIEGANGEGARVIKTTIASIEKLEVPNIHVSFQERKPDAGFIKEKRQFLIATHKMFDTYDMYISARDYGKQLFVAWYLVEEPVSFWRLFSRDPMNAIRRYPAILLRQSIAAMRGGDVKTYSTLNLFDTEELSAYVTTVHHALLESVQAMMEDQKLDSTKIERRTRGFLNVV